ncbi:MAG: MBL fold metallo-hydrolase, partial [Planctomycetes bacterium]|nr:MBL fold metallo-hydrolase [Planctomycetota bacterium]
MSTSANTLSGDAPRYPAGLHDFGGGIFGWLTPNGGWGESNAGLIVGHGAALLVDTLWDLRQTRRMLEAMAKPLTAGPIRQVVNTHSDGDHWWGNQLVAGAEIIATKAAARVMAHDTPVHMTRLRRLTQVFHGLSRLPLSKRWQEHWRTLDHYFSGMMQPFDFRSIQPAPATSTFSGSLRLEVGGREVRLLEVGPAHTAGDLIVHVPDARLVFAGDILFLGSTPVLWEGSVANWLTALDRILALEVDQVVPGHGPVGDGADIDPLKGYW